jgi:hypothetical protein
MNIRWAPAHRDEFRRDVLEGGGASAASHWHRNTPLISRPFDLLMMMIMITWAHLANLGCGRPLHGREMYSLIAHYVFELLPRHSGIWTFSLRAGGILQYVVEKFLKVFDILLGRAGRSEPPPQPPIWPPGGQVEAATHSRPSDHILGNR